MQIDLDRRHPKEDIDSLISPWEGSERLNRSQRRAAKKLAGKLDPRLALVTRRDQKAAWYGRDN